MRQLLQCDERWANIKLGTSNVLIKDAGCLLVCASMLADMAVGNLNNALIRVNGYQDQNLLIWSKLGEATNNKLTFNWLNYEYNNEGVKQVIADEGGCIVRVQNGDYMHFVLYIGNGKIYDPLSGEASTSKYPDVRGFADISVRKDVVVSPPLQTDNCPANLLQVISERDRLNGVVSGKDKIISDLNQQLSIISANINSLTSEKNSLSAQLLECQKQSDIYKKEYDLAPSLKEQLELLEKFKASWTDKEIAYEKQIKTLQTRLETIRTTMVPKKYLSLKIYNLIMNLE